jgi:hypothetical protein
MIKRWLLTSWNTEPFQLVTLALTIAPADSGTWESQDMTEGTKRGAWNSFCESTHIVIFRPPDWDALNDQQRCSSAGSYSWPGLKVRKSEGRLRKAEKYMRTSKGASPTFRYFSGRRPGAGRPRSEKNSNSGGPLVTGGT